MFQSTHPHGVRLLSASLILINTEFQSTHPHGVRPPPTEHDRGIRRFQSTHPHGVRRKARPSHARRDPCFNPRTHTGCDAICRSAAAYRKSFNPRTHTGCDYHLRKIPYSHASFQSTHPHGVRQIRGIAGCWTFSFNPRTHTGCDTIIWLRLLIFF